MKQWNGLLKKEWVTMRWSLISAVLFAIVVTMFVPHMIGRIFDVQKNVFEFTMIICFLWVLASTFAPLITLFIMLQREMKRPDVWLHSTASIFTLVGSKAFLALLVGAVSILVPTVVLALQYALLDPTNVPLKGLLFVGCNFVFRAFVYSIPIMATGLFFWVLDQLMKPLLKGLSNIATLIVFFLSSWLMSKLALSTFYQKIVLVGPIDLSRIEVPTFEFSEFGFTKTFFYTGQIVFDTLFTITAFVVAVVLFEKKVRL